MTMIRRVIINNVEYTPKDARISVFDRGFQFGDGVFETLPVVDGKPILLGEHYTRLQTGCSRLGIALHSCYEDIKAAVERICDGELTAVLKIVVTRGQTARGYACPDNLSPDWVVSLSDFTKWPDDFPKKGIITRLCKTRVSKNVSLAGLKHLNRLDSVLARREIANDEAEGILLDDMGNVLEGSMSNLFAVNKGELITPDLTYSGVCGIMRDYLLVLAESNAITARIEPIPATELPDMDELFVCNSLIGIWPVKEIRHVGKYKKGPITKKIQEALYTAQGFLAGR